MQINALAGTIPARVARLRQTLWLSKRNMTAIYMIYGNNASMARGLLDHDAGCVSASRPARVAKSSNECRPPRDSQAGGHHEHQNARLKGIGQKRLSLRDAMDCGDYRDPIQHDRHCHDNRPHPARTFGFGAALGVRPGVVNAGVRRAIVFGRDAMAG